MTESSRPQDPHVFLAKIIEDMHKARADAAAMIQGAEDNLNALVSRLGTIEQSLISAREAWELDRRSGSPSGVEAREQEISEIEESQDMFRRQITGQEHAMKALRIGLETMDKKIAEAEKKRDFLLSKRSQP